MEFKDSLLKLCNKEDLTDEEAYEVGRFIFSGDATEAEIAGALLALKTKGEKVNEIAYIAKAIKDYAPKFNYKHKNLLDNCGTGGDGANTFNISTTVSFVLVALGAKVAKHGNRAISSKSGSSDVLSELGVKIDLDNEAMEKILEEIGIVFIFAPNVHKKMKYVMPVRRALKIPTVLNLIGPLTNPFDLNGQLVGVPRKEYVSKMAESLKILGRENAVVINGDNKVDEAVLTGTNYISILKNGEIESIEVKASDYGIKEVSLEEIKGGTPKENADILKAVLKGQEGPQREVVVFNAALGLIACGITDTIEEGIELSKKALDTGIAYEKLEQLIERSNNVGSNIR